MALQQNNKLQNYQMTEEIQLAQQNLIPFYLIQDKLKGNFSKIATYISSQLEKNKKIQSKMDMVIDESEKQKISFELKLSEMEKKISSDINSELEGRIVVAINKKLNTFAENMEAKEKEIDSLNKNIDKKIDDVRKKILFEASKQNEKYMLKELQKIEKKIKQSNNSKKNQQSPIASKTSVPVPNASFPPIAPEIEELIQTQKQHEQKIKRLDEYTVSFDKRFYENMTSLKESWKQMAEDNIEGRRKMNSKTDEIKLELIRLRTTKQFSGGNLNNAEEQFKKNLMEKFNDIYHLVSNTITKNQFQSTLDSQKKTFTRISNQLSDVRQQFAKNNDYFTFYVNNSNNDDLSARMDALQADLQNKYSENSDKFKYQLKENQKFDDQLVAIFKKVQEAEGGSQTIRLNFNRLKENVFKFQQKIEYLQSQINFTPQKLSKIHNTLDVDFTPSEQELLSKKTTNEANNQNFREFRQEISKVKDQMFIMGHELTEMDKLKKTISNLEGKIQKIKFEAEESILSRKPWVCLSCDKNDKQGQLSQRKKEGSLKKLPSNFFHKDKSERNIKAEDKFEIYQKYREKYLSDALKLPQIYKEKIGDKEISLN